MGQDRAVTIERVRIAYLADHPQVIPMLARWFQGEWRSHYGPRSLAEVESEFTACQNRDSLPIAWVAMDGGEVCATASLRGESLTTHPHLGPWLAGLYVAATHRRRGIALRLMHGVSRKAAELDHETLYAATASATALFDYAQWRRLEQLTYHGKEVTLFVRDL